MVSSFTWVIVEPLVSSIHPFLLLILYMHLLWIREEANYLSVRSSSQNCRHLYRLGATWWMQDQPYQSCSAAYASVRDHDYLALVPNLLLPSLPFLTQLICLLMSCRAEMSPSTSYLLLLLTFWPVQVLFMNRPSIDEWSVLSPRSALIHPC